VQEITGGDITTDHSQTMSGESRGENMVGMNEDGTKFLYVIRNCEKQVPQMDVRRLKKRRKELAGREKKRGVKSGVRAEDGGRKENGSSRLVCQSEKRVIKAEFTANEQLRRPRAEKGG